MSRPGIRRKIGLLILLISLVLLAWSFWPLGHLTQTAPVAPADLQLPTPQSLILFWVF